MSLHELRRHFVITDFDSQSAGALTDVIMVPVLAGRIPVVARFEFSSDTAVDVTIEKSNAAGDTTIRVYWNVSQIVLDDADWAGEIGDSIDITTSGAANTSIHVDRYYK